MIAASAVMTVVAAVLFIIGLFSSGDRLIWASIAASIAALSSLVAGIVRTRQPATATFGGMPIGGIPAEPQMRVTEETVTDSWGAREPAVAAEPAVSSEFATTEDEEEAVEEIVLGPISSTSPPRPRSSARKPAVGGSMQPKPAPRAASPRAKTTARKPAARKTTAKPAPRKPAPRPRKPEAGENE